MKNIVFDGVRVLQAENEDLEKYYACKGKVLKFKFPVVLITFDESNIPALARGGSDIPPT